MLPTEFLSEEESKKKLKIFVLYQLSWQLTTHLTGILSGSKKVQLRPRGWTIFTEADVIEKTLGFFFSEYGVNFKEFAETGKKISFGDIFTDHLALVSYYLCFQIIFGEPHQKRNIFRAWPQLP